jgi:predicted nucleic acid-binding protein
MEWLKDRKRASDYLDLLLAKARVFEVQLFTCRMNLGEVYHTTAREWGTSRADVVLTRMQELPIDLVSVSGELVLQTHRISYADAFAAGLAMELRCPLVTGDPEFLALAKSGIIELDWIGA